MTLKSVVHFWATLEPDFGRFNPIQPQRARNVISTQDTESLGKCLKRLDARGGIEPPNKGFADLLYAALTSFIPNNSGRQKQNLSAFCPLIGKRPTECGSIGLGRT